MLATMHATMTTKAPGGPNLDLAIRRTENDTAGDDAV
jgi:hypothetical protein